MITSKKMPMSYTDKFVNIVAVMRVMNNSFYAQDTGYDPSKSSSPMKKSKVFTRYYAYRYAFGYMK